MAPTFKRKLSSTTRTESPPPLRRRLETSKLMIPPSHIAADSTNVTSSDDASSPLRYLLNILTFYSWNVNSILPLLLPDHYQISTFFTPPTKTSTSLSPSPLRTFLRSHSWPTLLCLQEVKIAANDTATQRRVQLAANTDANPSEPSYTAHFALPRDRYNATGFGGKIHGVTTLVRDDLGERHGISVATSRPDWDLEGRVLVHTLTSKSTSTSRPTSPPKKLVVINGYWANGTSNPYRSLTTGNVTGTRHDFKLSFHTHILSLCHSLTSQSPNTQILLLGDMNIAPSRADGHPNLRTYPHQHIINRADFNHKFLDPANADGFGGVDVFRHMYGEKRKYTYHGQGRPWGESCDRVDLAVAGRRLVEIGAVVGMDICDTPAEGGHSDHVPLWVRVDFEKLIDVGKEELRGGTTRNRSSPDEHENHGEASNLKVRQRRNGSNESPLIG